MLSTTSQSSGKPSQALILELTDIILQQKRNLAAVINWDSNDGAITVNHPGGLM